MTEEEVVEVDTLEALLYHIEIYRSDPDPLIAYNVFALYGQAVLEGYQIRRDIETLLPEMFVGALEQQLAELSILEGQVGELLKTRAEQLRRQAWLRDFRGRVDEPLRQAQQQEFRENAEAFGSRLHNMAGASWTLLRVYSNLPRERYLRYYAQFQVSLLARAQLAELLASEEATPLIAEGATLFSKLRSHIRSVPDDPIWWHLQVGGVVCDAVASCFC